MSKGKDSESRGYSRWGKQVYPGKNMQYETEQGAVRMAGGSVWLERRTTGRTGER